MAKEKRSFNAKLNAKGLENSVSEEQARHMAAHQGSRYMLVVEVHAGKKVVDEDGSETIHLIPDLVELVPTEHEERVRRFQRSLYMERPEQVGQRTIDSISDVEPSSEQTGAEMEANLPEYADPTGAPWDGNPDAPVEEPALIPSEGTCPSPWCTFPTEHDGDHNEDGKPVDSPNVVAFTHAASASD